MAEWWEGFLASALEKRERAEGPEWMLMTCFRAHTEEEAKAFTEDLQLFAKSYAREQGKPIEDFMLMRVESGDVEIVPD